MARPRSQSTLERLQEAALDVFGRKGWERARVADVAHRIGVAHGTVYGYAQGKEALFALALRGDDLPALASLPLAKLGPVALGRRVDACAAAIHALPELDAALEHATGGVGERELVGILGAHYDAVKRYARELGLLERTAAELPAVARSLARHRGGLQDRMRRYLESRVTAGWIEPVPDAGLAARAVLDAVAHCARRNHEEPDPVFRPESVARDTVVGWAARGLLVAPVAVREGDAPLH